MLDVIEGFSNDWVVMLAIVGVFVILDIVSGMFQAVYNNTMDSSTMRKGLFHKCGTMLALVFGFALNATAAYIDFGVTVPAAQVITGYIVVMESKSILENLGKVSDEVGNLARRIFPNSKNE